MAAQKQPESEGALPVVLAETEKTQKINQLILKN